jgi:type VI secretion system secreted protein VgrG
MAAIGFTQAARALRIDTPLAPDALLLRSVSGQEAVSQLFRFQLELLSEDDAIDFDSIVGKNVTLHLQIIDSERNINGFISRFSQSGRDERFTHYQAEMVPWLWFLTRKADCRIFQHKTAPDIIKKIFDELGFKDYELRLYSSYRSRDYCVQYRETDFNFVSRLMEEEGICYFFEHDKDGAKHTMVLADDAAAHKPCPGQEKARCDFSPGSWHPDDVISDWRVEQEYRPSAWSHTDYNFETPSTSLMVTVKDDTGYEIYDYPGLYSKKGDGDQLGKTRLQETRAFKERVTGKSNCRCFTTGATVEVTDHYRKEMNQKWMLTAVYHQSTMGEAYGSGGTDEGFFYTNAFEGIPASVPFRPPRVTPKPSVQGCQTAVVVGPAGEEIYTDKYGRVKVQFFWDREGKKNEDSSCWIRVSYPWAGKNWGGIHIPRIGQEVIVDFLEGDPDQPIIVGRVYHAERMPPWALPGKKVVSGFKSDSTKGGGGYNEISMDDTKGTELINIHAQYDQQKKVEHDERVNVGRNRTESVGNDESITIGHDRNEKVVNNETIAIGVNRTETVGSNENITIGSNRTENVGASESITVALTRTRNVGVNEMVNVGAAQEITIGGLQAITVGASRAVTVGASQNLNVGTSLSENVGTDRSENVGANQNVTVGSNLTENVGADQKTTIASNLTESVGSDHKNDVGGNRTTSVGSDDKLDVGSNLTISAGSQITLETGSSKIVMKSGGHIEISGMTIEIKGTTSVKAEAVTINVEASGINTIKGSLVKIN